MRSSSKNLSIEREAPLESARNSALTHFRSNTSFVKRETETEEEKNNKVRINMSQRLALRSAKP